MPPDLEKIATKIVEEFRNGDKVFGDYSFEVTFTRGYLAEAFREWKRNYCTDGTSLQVALECVGIFWSPKRIADIESGNANPDFDELEQWSRANPDLCEAVGILTVPLEHDGEVLGWALIENSGFIFDPNIELLGIFISINEVRQFIAKNFER